MKKHNTTTKFSFRTILCGIIIVGIIGFGLFHLMSSYYEKNDKEVKTQIENYPYYTSGFIEGRHTYKQSSFDIVYNYQNKNYWIHPSVSRKLLEQYADGDSIALIICKTKPELSMLR
jgi:hypothetical protein